MYYIYKHTSPSNKVYIGITIQTPSRRWQRGKGYRHNKYFYRAILKYGWDRFKHEILFDSLTKEEAEQKEIELIAFYKSNQKEFGYNIQNGGNLSGKNNAETRKKFSEIFKGRCPTKEARKNMSDSHVVKKVVQLDDEGNVLKIWNGCKTAAKELNIPYQNISECVKGKRYRKHAGGFVWRYAENVLH